MHELRVDSPPFGLKHSGPLNRRRTLGIVGGTACERRVFLRACIFPQRASIRGGECFVLLYFQHAHGGAGQRRALDERSFQIRLAVIQSATVLHYASLHCPLCHTEPWLHTRHFICVSWPLGHHPTPPLHPPPTPMLSFSCSSLYQSLEVNIGRRSPLL